MTEETHTSYWDLTAQQRRVVDGLLTGLSPAQIALNMGLEKRTVDWHIMRIHVAVERFSIGEFWAYAYKHRRCCSYFMPLSTGAGEDLSEALAGLEAPA